MPTPFPPAPRPVVVGVDGSAASAAALRWAAEVARRDGHELRVVTAYPAPTVANDAAGAYWEHHAEAAEAARLTSERALRATLGEVPADHVVVAGPADRAILVHSTDAAMVVLGTRRRRAWYHRWRASVTNRVTGAARCPVVSIPASDGADRAERPAMVVVD